MGMLRTVSQQMFKCKVVNEHSNVKHKRAVCGGSWLPGAAPLFIWKITLYKNWARSSWRADFGKRWSLSHFLRIRTSLCPHGLSSKSHAPQATLNLPNSAAGWRKTLQITFFLKANTWEADYTAPQKGGLLVVMIKLPSPGFQKFPAVFV